MNLKQICLIFLGILLILDIYSIFQPLEWLIHIIHIFFLLTAVIFFNKQYRRFNNHFYIFIICSILAFALRIFELDWNTNFSSLLLLIFAYLALILEATRYIERKSASSFMLLYFFLITGLNAYFLFAHVFEIKDYLPNLLEYSLYILYYINLMILGITAFIYYLNSYSKKSVYFISLVLALIFADVLRDMGIFYLKDPSVEVAEGILRLAASFFVVLFFVTKEKKLRLINMI